MAKKVEKPVNRNVSGSLAAEQSKAEDVAAKKKAKRQGKAKATGLRAHRVEKTGR